ncbi:MAG: hypothetical protein Q7T35_09075, partial [Nitrosomonas sp.]|nr:hypothetical protein [Nitrosomonas sp.]
EPKTLGEHILKRRLFLNMRQIEVAELFNVTHFTVGNWENGHSEPKFCHTPTLIKFLGYDPVNLNLKSIAELLFAKRRELGWSQRVAARNLGVNPCTWSSWECGGTIMMHKHRHLIAVFLGVIDETINKKMGMQWNKKCGK